MASAERILQLERGIVHAMEREMRQILTHREQEKVMVERRAIMAGKMEKLEVHRQEATEKAHKEITAKAEIARGRFAALQANVEEDKLVVAANARERFLHAQEKQQRIAADREAVKERHRTEGEAKREYIAQLREISEEVHETKRQEVLARIQAGEEKRRKLARQKELEIEEHRRRQLEKEKKK